MLIISCLIFCEKCRKPGRTIPRHGPHQGQQKALTPAFRKRMRAARFSAILAHSQESASGIRNCRLEAKKEAASRPLL